MYYFIVKDLDTENQKVFSVETDDLYTACHKFKNAYMPYIEIAARPNPLCSFFENDLGKELIIININKVINIL